MTTTSGYDAESWDDEPQQWTDVPLLDGALEPVTDETWMTPLPAEPDPFDLPPHDPVTGELIEPAQAAEPVQSVTSLPPVDGSPLPMLLAEHGALAVSMASDVQPFAADLGAYLEERISAQYDALVRARPTGAVTAEVVAAELRWSADAHEVLSAIGRVFTHHAGGVRELAGQAVQEVRADRDIERKGGSASVKVGAAAGAAVKVTATRATETFAEDEQIVDVLVPMLLDGHPVHANHADAYARGARAMAATLIGTGGTGLLMSPKWKSSALDALRERLQGADDVASTALATRLRAAYGRRPVGNVTTKIERVDAKEVRDL